MDNTAPAYFWVITYGTNGAILTPFATHKEAVKDAFGDNSAYKEVVGTSTTRGRTRAEIAKLVEVIRLQGVNVTVK